MSDESSIELVERIGLLDAATELNRSSVVAVENVEASGVDWSPGIELVLSSVGFSVLTMVSRVFDEYDLKVAEYVEEDDDSVRVFVQYEDGCSVSFG